MGFENSGKVDPDAPPSYASTVFDTQQLVATPSAPPVPPLQAPHTTGPPPPVPSKVPGSPQTIPSASLYAPESSTSVYSAIPLQSAGSSTVQSFSNATLGSYPAMAAIAFSQENKIRLVDVPPTLLPSIRSAIHRGWGRPVKEEREFHGSYELETNGQPWDDPFREKFVRSRQLLTHLVGAMVAHGWHLTQVFNTTQKEDGKDTLFFEPASGGPDPQAHLVTVGFKSSDKIVLLLDNSQNAQFVPLLRQCILSHWSKGIQAEKNPEGAHEFKLTGNPFLPIKGESSVQNRKLMMALMTCLQPLGYRLYVTFRVNDDDYQMGTWIFRRVGPHWH